MEERHSGFGERIEIFERRSFRHEAPQRGVSSVDASHFIRVFDGPGVGFASRRPGALEHRLFGKAVAGHELVSGVPLGAHGAGDLGTMTARPVRPHWLAVFSSYRS